MKAPADGHSMPVPPILPDKLDALKIDRTERDGRRYGIGIGAVVVSVVVIGAVAWWLSRPAGARVRTVSVRQGEVSGERTVLNASGYVTARRQATVSSKVTGKVVEVLIEEGMEVEKGRVMARLDSSNVQAALELAEAELAAAHSALAETGVQLDEAGREVRRLTDLVAGGVAGQRELDRARAEADSLAARLTRQRDEVKVAERAVALRRQDLEDTIIRAPFSGKVVAKNAQPGEMISPISAGGGFTRTGIGTIVDMSSLEIEVDVNESYINRVEPGQPVVAVLDAYPDWRIPARVIAIIPTADRDKATVRVRIAFQKLEPKILPEMGVKVSFFAEGEARAGPVLLVPRESVHRENEQDVVFVVSNGRVERRAIRLGPAEGKEVQVLAGLSAGEKVVVQGPADLADGDPVKEIAE